MRISDWCSDVCSSDLHVFLAQPLLNMSNLTLRASMTAAATPVSTSASVSAMHDTDAEFSPTAIFWSGVPLLAAPKSSHPKFHAAGSFPTLKLGSASCGESVCQYVSISGVSV